MDKVEIKIINLLAKLELTVSKLYKVYAQKYPEYKNFWNELVKEEEGHAQLMKSIEKYIKKGLVKLDQKRCNENAVETIFHHIEERLQIAKQSVIPLRDAFGLALRIEKNIIEKDFCTFFEGDDAEFRKMCEIITWETSQHKDKIEKVLEGITL